MDRIQKNNFQAFGRVQGWLGEHPDVAVLVTPLSSGLNTVLASLRESAALQDSHLRLAKSATADARRIRRELVDDHMRLIARLAEVSIPDVVKATAALKMPSGKQDVVGWLTSAESMAKAAEANLDGLVKAGLPADGVTQLRNVAERLKQVMDAREQLVAQRAGATAVVDAHIAEARKLVESISVFVTRGIRSNPGQLAEWKQLKRVVAKPGASATVGAPAPVPSAPPAPAAEPNDVAGPAAEGPAQAKEVKAA